MPRLFVASIVVGLLLLPGVTGLAPNPAAAATIGVCASDGDATNADGRCTKLVDLVGTTLTITLTNTTAPGVGGFLTADAFFLPTAISVTDFTTTNANFTLSMNPAVNPYGNHDMIFNWLISATNDEWNGGGSPSGGIAAGASATFTLLLSSAAGLTEQMILDSEAIRFRGFTGGGSDKDLAGAETAIAAPEPTAVLLVGMGVVGVAFRARRRRLQTRS
jgi:hypothetical protein